MKSRLVYFLFIIIPAFLMITSADTIQTRGNTWYGGDYDPAYCYLLNSLNNAYLKRAGHIDHPGTTAQVYGAVVLRVYHLLDLNEPENLQTAVLKDPERHLFIMNYSFLVLNCIFIFFIGIVAFKTIKNIWLVLLLQAAPFYSSVALYNGLTRVTQESMLLLSTMMMLMTVIWQFTPGMNRAGKKNILLFGLVTGFGMASKIIFFPLVFLPLLLIPEFKNKLRYIIYSVGAFVLFTFPIWTQYRRMFNWFYLMLTHTGTYGNGNTGLLDKATYFKSIINILKTDNLFLVIISISLLVLFCIYLIPQIRRNLSDKLEIKVLQATIVVQLLGLFLVGKMPDIRYMLPYSGLLVINIFCILSLIRYSQNKYAGKYLMPVIVSILLIVIPYSAIKAKNNYYTPMANNEYEASLKKLSGYDNSYARVFCLPSSSVVPSFVFGNVYAWHNYTSELSSLYPNSFFYEPSSHKLITWDQEISFDILKEKFGNKIVLVNQLRGYPLTPEDLQFLASQGLYPEDVFGGKFQTVYELKVAENNMAGQQERKLNILFCDAENVSKDQHYFIAPDGSQFEIGAIRTEEKTHSGKYSVKLTPASPYAMTLTIDDLKPGDKYEVSAWRWGGDKDGYLVASCEDHNLFYSQSNFSLSGETKGWIKVIMSFTLPDGIAGKKMKIFTWNSGRNTIYFDDLEIIKKN